MNLTELLMVINAYEHGVILDNSLFKHNIHNDDQNIEKLKTILKSAQIVYVAKNMHFRNTLNADKFIYDYNDDNSLNLNDVYRMIYNSKDCNKCYYDLPFSYKKLVNFYDKMNIQNKVYLVNTKYNYWEISDVNVKELFEEYTNKENYEDSSYFTIPHRSILFHTYLGNLKPTIKIPLRPIETCRVFFIAIETNNGMTVFSRLCSLLKMPNYSDNDNKYIDEVEGNNENNESDEIDEKKEDNESDKIDGNNENNESDKIDGNNDNNESDKIDGNNENNESDKIDGNNENIKTNIDKNDNNNMKTTGNKNINKNKKKKNKNRKKKNKKRK